MDDLAEIERMYWGDTSPSDHSGELTLSAQAKCGCCEAWWTTANANSLTSATRMLRNRGWRLTKWDGWICPACAKR